MLDWKTFRAWHKYESYGHTWIESRKEYQKLRKEEKDRMNCDIETYACNVTTTCVPAEKAPRPSSGSTYSLGTVEAATPLVDWGTYKEKGNNPMNYATATVQAGTTETQDQRKYLTQRLETIYYKLEEPLFAAFGLSDDRAPSTPKELKERIADGKFIIKGVKDFDVDDDEEDSYFYCGWTDMIRWRDPAKKADRDGYTAARKELADLRQKTLDIIKIDEPKAGLDAIKALEAWEPSKTA